MDSDRDCDQIDPVSRTKRKVTVELLIMVQFEGGGEDYHACNESMTVCRNGHYGNTNAGSVLKTCMQAKGFTEPKLI